MALRNPTCPARKKMTCTFVIAEIAGCHGGDRAKMSEAIQVAAAAGADACKFQWTSSPERLAARRHAEEYLWAYRTLAFPREWMPDLAAECFNAGIEWMCTVYLHEDIHVIAPWVKRFKVASFEAHDPTFLAAHAYGKPMLISTGGMTRQEFGILVQQYAEWGREGGMGRVDFLHCVSGYPAPMDELNLALIGEEPSDDFTGFSDHTANVLTGALAAARGARVIEVHFRLASTDAQNPDYLHSLTPPDLIRDIANVRLAEAALGDGKKRVMPSEERWLRYKVKA